MTGGQLPAAVLWDMDGTLVDTEPYWIECEHALVAAHGGAWSREHAEQLVGQPLLVSAAYIARHGGVDLPPEEIVEVLLDGVIARTAGQVPWVPGARELVAALSRHGIPQAMVTMSYRRLAEVVTAALPSGTFDALVTGDQVRYGKPHPEPYLTAAGLLGVDITRCVVIEDSAPGVASGEAAGAIVLAVPRTVPIPPAPGRIMLRGLAGVSIDWLADLAAARPPHSLERPPTASA